jgi:hypothetical protein
MKTIFTILFSVGITIASFAQSSHRNDYPSRDNRDVYGQRDDRNVYNDRNDNNNRRYETYNFTAKERDEAIRNINRDFKDRIKAVRKSRSLRSSEKDREVRRLEWQRDRAIDQVNDRFTSNRNTYNNRYAGRDDRRTDNRKW